MSEKEHKVSRRQFLTYTLTGVGGFMAAGMLMPMARFALDPALKAGADSDLITVADLSELTEEPQLFPMTYTQDDAWYTSEVSENVFLMLNGDDVLALSPTCTHLGCQVAFGTNEDHPEQFYCPCHFGRFDKQGNNIQGTPPTRPLDAYEVVVEDGKVKLGSIYQRQGGA
ncbi:ubiquinol-cytochrome c reductase iron-sulfur subunit [Alkalihalobacillus pseudalcaliphilus]|uniref:QcrA and Rieske domain-containing protein n=1 Tax=Alkalihalobacillus pseudalcaliphilus TaxID=79884 RepID=UPI00064DB26B|nr:ubiquinol-cytochrome c reductase iron-sulfur subunit [Alkalihalobacillus pseudalcaliphilus]KMK76423.1 menaquinol-cytochrome C reductase [Alkalihalobacillus pseudalcaliphilus]